MKTIRNVFWVIALALLGCGSVNAQNWASIGKFNIAPNIAWYDAQEDRMLVAGLYTWFDSSEIHGFGQIVGDTVIGLGCGFDVPCGTQVIYNSRVNDAKAFARYKGELFVTGTFLMAGGNPSGRIAKWQGNDWVAIGSGLSTNGNPGGGIGFGLEVMDNILYLYGAFDSINGIEAHSLAKYDGTSWGPVFNLPKFMSSLNRIYDAEWFEGELYIGGDFHKPGSNPPIHGLAKWNGFDWVGVDVGLFGTFPNVSALATYQGKLVIAGHFNKHDTPGSIPGNGITIWDGQVWDTLQGGVQYRVPGGWIRGILINGDALYAYGLFDSAGGYPARNLAMWDGNRWCGLEESNDFVPTSIGFYHDTLFMTIGSESVGGIDSISRFAKWIGGANLDGCRLVASPELENEIDQISLYPNPTNSSFKLTLPPNTTTCTLEIHDITGREVAPACTYRAGDPPVDVAHLSAGLYFVEVRVKDRVEVIKLVKQ
ncbi:MAG: T9SS type A sorting domain-containing protein [Bacteroidetes bacterium]|nr:T9SS type A sorting domain-containing protein [Bacteroidota bacterium]